MNKYQEALNGAIESTNVINNCCSFIGECIKNGDCKFNDDRLMCDDYVCFKTLEELIEKNTPKKVVDVDTYIDFVDGYTGYSGICPTCREWCYDNHDSYYCGGCGQALDWGEKDV